jgi:hypothetical protein
MSSDALTLENGSLIRELGCPGAADGLIDVEDADCLAVSEPGTAAVAEVCFTSALGPDDIFAIQCAPAAQCAEGRALVPGFEGADQTCCQRLRLRQEVPEYWCGSPERLGKFVVTAWTNLRDSDYDLFADLEDNCPAVINLSQADSNADGVGDACDPSADGPEPVKPGDAGAAEAVAASVR